MAGYFIDTYTSAKKRPSKFQTFKVFLRHDFAGKFTGISNKCRTRNGLSLCSKNTHAGTRKNIRKKTPPWNWGVKFLTLELRSSQNVCLFSFILGG